MDPLNNSDTVVEGGEDLFVKVTKKTDNTSFASSAIVTNQKAGNPTKLPVSISFELFENDSELFSGEARPADMEISHIIVDKVIPISLNVEDTSLEREHLSPPPFLEVPRDPNFDEYLVLQPSITPITTTDEILGPDKRKVQFIEGTKNVSAASLKSAKILSKFWGDVMDTDASDGKSYGA